MFLEQFGTIDFQVTSNFLFFPISYKSFNGQQLLCAMMPSKEKIHDINQSHIWNTKVLSKFNVFFFLLQMFTHCAWLILNPWLINYTPRRKNSWKNMWQQLWSKSDQEGNKICSEIIMMPGKNFRGELKMKLSQNFSAVEILCEINFCEVSSQKI